MFNAAGQDVPSDYHYHFDLWGVPHFIGVKWSLGDFGFLYRSNLIFIREPVVNTYRWCVFRYIRTKPLLGLVHATGMYPYEEINNPFNSPIDRVE